MGKRHQVKGLEGLPDEGHGPKPKRQGKFNSKIIIAKRKRLRVSSFKGMGFLGPQTQRQSPESAPILQREN